MRRSEEDSCPDQRWIDMMKMGDWGMMHGLVWLKVEG